jgi:hypothetical protein
LPFDFFPVSLYRLRRRGKEMSIRFSILRHVLVFAIIVWPFLGSASELGDGVHKGGVTVVATGLNDRVLFCFAADDGFKISGQYGVEFPATLKAASLWNEKFPKIVAIDDQYFALPMRISLNTKGHQKERHISLKLGACSVTCNELNFQITIPTGGESQTRNLALCAE